MCIYCNAYSHKIKAFTNIAAKYHKKMQVKQFKQELFRISWYMRGGVTVNDLLHVYSADDREFIYNVINENIESTKVSGLPLL